MSRQIETEKRDRIRALNDRLRKTLSGGRVMLTQGFQALPEDARNNALRLIAEFNAFTTDNDPHGEHDFGAIKVRGENLFWKIDYYDASLEFGSEDPSNSDITRRVLTIMLADEY